MNAKSFSLRWLLILCGLALAVVPPVRAEDAATVRARMAERLSKIDALKAAGTIGENNRGFTELRGGGSDAGDVVAAENRDRETVYAAIAKQQGVAAEQVGKARARQIASGSASGVWLQRDDGEWYKK